MRPPAARSTLKNPFDHFQQQRSAGHKVDFHSAARSLSWPAGKWKDNGHAHHTHDLAGGVRRTETCCGGCVFVPAVRTHNTMRICVHGDDLKETSAERMETTTTLPPFLIPEIQPVSSSVDGPMLYMLLLTPMGGCWHTQQQHLFPTAEFCVRACD